MADAQPEQEPTQSLDQGAPATATGAQDFAPAAPEESDDDYDPSNLITDTTTYDPHTAPAIISPTVEQTLKAPLRSASQVSNKPQPAAAKPPRVKGGFAVDDSSDEEGAPASRPGTAASNGHMNVVPSASPPAQTSLPQNTDNSTTLPSVPVKSPPQDQSVAGNASPALASPPVQAPTAVSSRDTGVATPTVQPPQPLPSPAKATAPAASAISSSMASTLPKPRLPKDRVGILEDRIADDPLGDVEAWLELINEHRKRNKLAEARSVYKRFFDVFPHAGEQWVNCAKMEADSDNFSQLETLFRDSLLNVPYVKLWSLYLDYVRRRNNLTTDTSGNARQTVTATFAFVLDNIGIDRDSGPLWQEYIDFIKSGPGTAGGSSWQDQQKMDQLRKAYQGAVVVPHHATNAIWTEYNQFEMNLNKVTGRKFVQEKSPSFVTARSSAVAMANFLRPLDRTTLPKLPPLEGCEGYQEYMDQVKIWKQWIQWEKDDPLVLKEEDPKAYQARVIYVYKQALMALRFWPEMWYEAAEFCFEHDIKSPQGVEQGKAFLEQGIAANPESLLLSFKRADKLELETANESGEESRKKPRGDTVRDPYNKLLDALYALGKKTEVRREQAIARAKEQAEQEAQEEPEMKMEDADEDEDQVKGGQANKKEEALKKSLDVIQKGADAELELLKKLITSAWVGLMRAMRRVQGKGKVNDEIGGSRQVFADARKRGWITSEVYVASALMEHYSYKDPAATRILEKGVKLYPEDEYFALEYLKHLISINDVTNARAVFETTVNRLSSKPDLRDKAKGLYAYFHAFESQYGELNQVIKLEKRMSELWPSDPVMELFEDRFKTPTFNPTAVRPIISHATQTKPKQQYLPSVEKSASAANSPRPPAAYLGARNSPKRPLVHDEYDHEALPPRKFARGESPLKGAAGRRLDASRRSQLAPQAAAAPTLPKEVMYLLSILPSARAYDVQRFNAEKMVQLIGGVDLKMASLKRIGA